MEQFVGQAEHAIDDRGRTAMPAELQKTLVRRARGENPNIVVRACPDGCLVVGLAAEWFQEAEKYANKRQPDVLGLDRQATRLHRALWGSVHETKLDGHARLVVPPELRRFARIGETVLWVGVGSSVELWSPERWAEAFGAALESLSETAGALATTFEASP